MSGLPLRDAMRERFLSNRYLTELVWADGSTQKLHGYQLGCRCRRCNVTSHHIRTGRLVMPREHPVERPEPRFQLPGIPAYVQGGNGGAAGLVHQPKLGYKLHGDPTF